MLILWLEDFALTARNRPLNEVQAQIDEALCYHANRFLLWNPTGFYTEEVLK